MQPRQQVRLFRLYIIRFYMYQTDTFEKHPEWCKYNPRYTGSQDGIVHMYEMTAQCILPTDVYDMFGRISRHFMVKSLLSKHMVLNACKRSLRNQNKENITDHLKEFNKMMPCQVVISDVNGYVFSYMDTNDAFAYDMHEVDEAMFEAVCNDRLYKDLIENEIDLDNEYMKYNPLYNVEKDNFMEEMDRLEVIKRRIETLQCPGYN